MNVQILIPRILGRYAPEDFEITPKGDTVQEVLHELRDTYPDLHNAICDETGKLRPHINLFLDRELFERKYNQRLKMGVTVSIYQSVSGG